MDSRPVLIENSGPSLLNLLRYQSQCIKKSGWLSFSSASCVTMIIQSSQAWKLRKAPKLAGMISHYWTKFMIDTSVQHNINCFNMSSCETDASCGVSSHATWSDKKWLDLNPEYNFMQKIWRIFLLSTSKFLTNCLSDLFSNFNIVVVDWFLNSNISEISSPTKYKIIYLPCKQLLLSNWESLNHDKCRESDSSSGCW